MDHEDEYDEFDDYNYDDAAEDWEAEAEQEERDAQAKEAALAARREEKLATRAPLEAAEDDTAGAPQHADEAEESVERALQRALDALHSEAAAAASNVDLLDDIAEHGGKDTRADGDDKDAATVRPEQLFAQTPLDSSEAAVALGARLAAHLARFGKKSNFDDVLVKLFDTLAGDFKDMTVLNRLIAKTHVAQEELKRKPKEAKTHKSHAAAAAAVARHDALGFDAIDDKAGAVARAAAQRAGTTAAAHDDDDDDDNNDFM